VAIITDQTTFNNTYWTSKSPGKNALRLMQGSPKRMQAALLLAQAGEIVDVEIDAYGWDPFSTMQERQADGYIWTLSALMAQPVDGNGIPTTNAFSTLPIPAMGIKVSTDSADYPPFAQAGPAYDPAVLWVGAYIIDNTFNTTAAAKAMQASATPIPTGYIVNEKGHIFKAFVPTTPGDNGVLVPLWNDMVWIMQT